MRRDRLAAAPARSRCWGAHHARQAAACPYLPRDTVGTRIGTARSHPCSSGTRRGLEPGKRRSSAGSSIRAPTEVGQAEARVPRPDPGRGDVRGALAAVAQRAVEGVGPPGVHPAAELPALRLHRRGNRPSFRAGGRLQQTQPAARLDVLAGLAERGAASGRPRATRHRLSSRPRPRHRPPAPTRLRRPQAGRRRSARCLRRPERAWWSTGPPAAAPPPARDVRRDRVRCSTPAPNRGARTRYAPGRTARLARPRATRTSPASAPASWAPAPGPGRAVRRTLPVRGGTRLARCRPVASPDPMLRIRQRHLLGQGSPNHPPMSIHRPAGRRCPRGPPAGRDRTPSSCEERVHLALGGSCPSPGHDRQRDNRLPGTGTDRHRRPRCASRFRQHQHAMHFLNTESSSEGRQG